MDNVPIFLEDEPPTDPPAPQAEVEAARRSGLPLDEQLAFANSPHYEVRAALASNPTIAPETFRALEDEDFLRSALLENPACPPDVLERFALLGHDPTGHPNATDIVLSFWETLEDQDFTPYYDPTHWITEDDRTIETLLWNSSRDAFEYYLRLEPATQRLADHYLPELWSAQQPSAPAFLLERIVVKLGGRLAHLRAIRLENLDLPAVAQEAAKIDEGQHLAAVLEAVAAHPNTPADLLTKLVDLNHPAVSGAVARNPSTKLPALKRCADSFDHDVQVAAAEHPSQKVRKVFQTLLVTNRVEVHVALAANTHLSSWQLDELYATNSQEVMAALASNPTLGPRTVEKFASSQDPLVRAAAAANSVASAETLARLAADPDDTVVLAVARNPSAPPATLVKLYATRPQAHPALAANPATPPEIINELLKDPDNHPALAGNASLTEATQLELAASANTAVHHALAKNPTATAQTLDNLSHSSDPVSLLGVALHEATTPATLARLAEADIPWKARVVARRRLDNLAGTIDQKLPYEFVRWLILEVLEKPMYGRTLP